MQLSIRSITLLGSAVLLSACGGGSTQTAGIDRGGISTSAIGPVTGFGSIFLNGERYALDNAEIRVDGDPATQADLAIGQVVALTGTSDEAAGTRTATTVNYESNLEGPVSSVNSRTGTLTILGQTVTVDANTVWGGPLAGNGIAGIVPGELLEISGLTGTGPGLRGTRVERSGPLDTYVISGIVADLRPAESTFLIGAQRVNYSAATLAGFSDGQLGNGDRVRVKTRATEQDTLAATTVTLSDSKISANPEDTGEIEGLVRKLVVDAGTANFELSGVAVRTNSATEFSGGTFTSLTPDARVEAEGKFAANGILVADKIEFRREADVEIEATVDSTQAGANQIAVLGITIEISGLTLIEDKTDQDLRPFTIADINPGDFLKIAGYESSASDTIIATKLERIDPEDELKLRGTARITSAPGLEILGVSILTDDQTEYSVNESPVGASEFFAVADGQIVEAKGSRQGASLVAKELELDD